MLAAFIAWIVTAVADTTTRNRDYQAACVEQGGHIVTPPAYRSKVYLCVDRDGRIIEPTLIP